MYFICFLVFLVLPTALLCLTSVYAVCYQVRYRHWDEMLEMWWYYGVTAVCVLLLLTLI